MDVLVSREAGRRERQFGISLRPKGVSEEEALRKGVEEKAVEFKTTGDEIYKKA